jgi:hypothetical protein
MRRPLFCAIAGVGMIVGCVAGSANAADHSTITAILENDSFVRGIDDRHYTSGFYLSWTSAKSAVTDRYVSLADTLLLLPSNGPAAYRRGFFFGQSIFTPEALLRINPDPRDRPYAGWLYVGARLYRETDDTLDRLEVQLGVVGPWSLARNAQTFMHALRVFGGAHPNGWGSQIHNEPGLVLTEQRIWRSGPYAFGPLEADVLPEATLSVGNIYTYAGAGVNVRIGTDLNASWGPPRIAPALQGADFVNDDVLPLSSYAFVGIEERAIARNIFLDGNSLRTSANVAKEPFVADIHAGYAIIWNQFSLYLTYTKRGREFKAQRKSDQTLSITTSFSH